MSRSLSHLESKSLHYNFETKELFFKDVESDTDNKRSNPCIKIGFSSIFKYIASETKDFSDKADLLREIALRWNSYGNLLSRIEAGKKIFKAKEYLKKELEIADMKIKTITSINDQQLQSVEFQSVLDSKPDKAGLYELYTGESPEDSSLVTSLCSYSSYDIDKGFDVSGVCFWRKAPVFKTISLSPCSNCKNTPNYIDVDGKHSVQCDSCDLTSKPFDSKMLAGRHWNEKMKKIKNLLNEV